MGSYIVRHLVLDQGVEDVVVLDRTMDDAKLGEAAGRVKLVHADVLEPLELTAAMRRFIGRAAVVTRA